MRRSATRAVPGERRWVLQIDPVAPTAAGARAAAVAAVDAGRVDRHEASSPLPGKAKSAQDSTPMDHQQLCNAMARRIGETISVETGQGNLHRGAGRARTDPSRRSGQAQCRVPRRAQIPEDLVRRAGDAAAAGDRAPAAAVARRHLPARLPARALRRGGDHHAALPGQDGARDRAGAAGPPEPLRPARERRLSGLSHAARGPADRDEP
jgi:hypothetical protein